MDDPARREAIDRIVMLLKSVLAARQRVMIEVNVSDDRLNAVIDALPSMGEPTVASLYNNAGFAVKAAIPTTELAAVIPLIKQRGGMDIVVTRTANIVA